jgi:serine/threonine-protein kinase RsbW
MAAQVVLSLTGPMDHLRLVWQTGEAMLESLTFDEDPEGTRYNILLALQEMVTNVLRHAYELHEDKPIVVSFSISDDHFEICLRDQGPAFDPLAHDTADVASATDMPVEVGGYGIYIARLVMDELAYERQDGWNCLRLKKNVRVTAQAK